MLAALAPGYVLSQETADKPIILGRTPAEQAAGQPTEVFQEAEILMLPGGQTLSALRKDTTADARYSFKISAVPLIDLLGALAGTLYTAPDYVQPAGTLDVQDERANNRTVSMSVEKVTITEALDQAAIASGCNIYLENLTIIVDRCN
jgi:hypothetical protein